jgi:hypothetical protein
MNELEIWKDIKTIPYHQAEWPFHQVSNFGRIRALPGAILRGRRIATQVELRQLTCDTSTGYMRVGKGQLLIYVHILVLNQFWGPCPPGQECRHLNGNRSDNRWPENLVWGTPKENQQDRIQHGTNNKGERNGRCKLTESQVIDIKSRPESAGIVKQLAMQYKVSRQAISHIRNDRTWKHLE